MLTLTLGKIAIIYYYSISVISHFEIGIFLFWQIFQFSSSCNFLLIMIILICITDYLYRFI